MKQKLSPASVFFLLIVLVFGIFSYCSFGETLFFMAAGETNRVPFFTFQGQKDTENRAKAIFPTRISFSFPKQFDAFYIDNFPMRPFFISRFQKLRKKIKDDPRVIVGVDNWMYSNSSPQAVYAKTGNILGDFTGKTLLNDKDKADFTANMACQKEFFDKNGIRLIVMVPPNKISIYPEFLTKAYQKQEAKYNRYSQIQEILNQLGIEFIDLKTLFLNSKEKGHLYFKTDTHWSKLGAYLGFKELTGRMGYAYPEMTAINRITLGCGDVYNMSVAISKSCTDINDIPVLPEDKTPGVCERSPRDQKITCTNPQAPVKGHTLIIRDSMFSSLIDDVKRSFEKSTLLWRSMHTENELLEEIKKERPDTVVYEAGERFLLEIQNSAVCPDSFVQIERLDQRAPAQENK